MKSPVAAAIVAVLLGLPAFARATAGEQAPIAPQAQPPQPPPPVFRAQVDAVEIDAFVTDAQGNPVTNLTVDDFEVLENGRPQTITSLSLVNIPVERLERPLFSPTAIEPDVQTNHGDEGRLYVIALDEVHPLLALRTRHFLRRFLEEHFAANDVAAVVFVGRGKASDAQDFTSNRRLLLAAIDKFAGGFPREALPNAPADTGGQDPAADAQAAVAQAMQLSRAGEDESLTRARMRSLRDLLEFMATLRGRRKTMLYVTERLTEGTPLQQTGDVFSVLDYNGGTRSIGFEDLHAAMTAATRGNVSIYPVDPTGLSPDGGLGDAELAPTAPGAAGLSRLQELRALAQATGGFALVNTNNFDQAFARIVRENSAYYVLGFTSSNDRADGRYRRLQVRVRRPGLTVRARDGYVAPLRRQTPEPAAPPKTVLSASVAAAIGVPMPNPAVPMAVSALALKGAGRDATIALSIELDASRLGLVDTGSSVDGEVEIATVAVSAGGKVHGGEHQRVKLTLKPDTYERAVANGVRVLSSMTLPPGRYQLRVAAGNVMGRAGSVMYDLDVPDFTDGALTMSGVALTSRSATQAFTAAVKDPLRDLLPSPATAAREFASGDRLAIYAEVYENQRSSAAHTVSLKVELRSDEGRALQTIDEDRSSTELEGTSGGYGLRAELPLDVDPGIYVVHIEARANISGQPTVSRDIQIRVK